MRLYLHHKSINHTNIQKLIDKTNVKLYKCDRHETI